MCVVGRHNRVARSRYRHASYVVGAVTPEALDARREQALRDRIQELEARLEAVGAFVTSHLDPHGQGVVVAARVAERIREVMEGVSR